MLKYSANTIKTASNSRFSNNIEFTFWGILLKAEFI
jgi:hypothetical protein